LGARSDDLQVPVGHHERDRGAFDEGGNHAPREVGQKRNPAQFAAQFIMRVVSSSIPVCALMTTMAVSTASRLLMA